MQKNRIGKIIKAGDVSLWPHEEATAKVLALYGHDVEFIRKSNREREHSADAYIDGMKWEFKSPTANHTKTILKNLKDAKWQADSVIIDARRMKRVPNDAILRELRSSSNKVAEIKHIKLISKTGKLIDIK